MPSWMEHPQHQFSLGITRNREWTPLNNVSVLRQGWNVRLPCVRAAGKQQKKHRQCFHWKPFHGKRTARLMCRRTTVIPSLRNASYTANYDEEEENVAQCRRHSWSCSLWREHSAGSLPGPATGGSDAGSGATQGVHPSHSEYSTLCIGSSLRRPKVALLMRPRISLISTFSRYAGSGNDGGSLFGRAGLYQLTGR